MADPTPPNQPNAAANLADQALKAAQAAIASLKGAAATPPPAAPEPEPTAEEAAMLAAMAAPAGKPQAAPGPSMAPPVQAFQLPSFERPAAAELPKGMDLLSDVNLNVKIELGRTRMVVEDVLKLGEGAVVELDKLAGDPVDVYVNDRHIARGEVLVLNDNFCVRINEIMAHVDGTPGGKSSKK
jgi:flagellar motor switch protein FliN